MAPVIVIFVDESPVDAALIVVHVQDSSTLASTKNNHSALVGIIVVCCVLFLLSEYLYGELCCTCRTKPPELFMVDSEGWLYALDTLVEDTYTMTVIARDERPVDAALIVVHVQDSSTLASTKNNHSALVGIVVVCCVLFLLLLILIPAFIVKYRRYVIHQCLCFSKLPNYCF